MNAKAKKVVPYLIILLICAYFYYLADQFRFAARPGHLGPGFWPKLLLGLTMVACLYETIKTAFFWKAQPVAGPARKKTEQTSPEKRSYPGLLIIGIAMTLAYVSLVGTLGFALSTFLYFAAFMFVGRYRNLWSILGNSLIGTLALVFIFMKVVYVSLPLGQGPFSTLSLFIMRMMGVK